ncbi:MAG: hypothetical protein OCU16_07915 [Candidatus Methanospirare jalkutatii]|nr:hypothetical protein [Candidatus Methanospirare jalkutatii]
MEEEEGEEEKEKEKRGRGVGRKRRIGGRGGRRIGDSEGVSQQSFRKPMKL